MRNLAPVAYRYARSLMDMAREQGQLEAMQADMRLVADTCAGNRDLVVILKSPVVKSDAKGRILDGIFGDKVGAITRSYMGILVRKGREALLADVASAFTELFKMDQNIVTAVVSSAVALNADTRAQVIGLAKKQHPGKTIDLQEKVDPTLIGGLSIRIGDEQYDGTVSRRLADLRREFSKNPYIPAI
ncbi:MAG: ATP synthase F1 subunit delta [Flavobacteriales bacterium]|nr:ATP synthase F1 subunit delta [Flavobacteriales bacterium]